MTSAAKVLRPHTLNDIAESAGVKKRAVQAWLAKAKDEHGEIGEIVNSTRMFSDADRDTLLSYQSQRKTNDTAPAAEMPATPAQVTVYEGNHRQTLPAPQFPAEYDLGSMRSELATVESHDDPLALATQFIDGANALIDAMEQDEKTMADKIAKTRQARAAVGRKAEQLKRRHDIYSLRSEILADRQNVETAALNEDFAELQSLGKSAS